MRSMRWTSTLLLSAGLLIPGCGDDGETADAAEGNETTGDGDGDPTSGDGDGDGDPTTGDGDGDGDGDPTTGDGDGDGDGDPTTGDGDGDGDPTTGDGDGDGDPTTGDGDGDGDAVCGNSLIEAGEECDDGNTLDEDGCLGNCVNSSCGDGFVNMGVEACDDGVNDGAYGGCEVGCQALGPYCGDAEVNGPEACDDGNDDSADGCLAVCSVPSSCLVLYDADNALPNGEYMIQPVGFNGMPFEVYCDMSSDGGGYTFLKIDGEGNQFYASQAETECATWGMKLWIPRSNEHKNSGWTIANDGNVGSSASPDYMRILGIYPEFNGAGCANQPMNSSNPNCGWGASDGGPWYVHDVNNISEPNGDNDVNGSMYYQWQNGQIQWLNDIGGAGYSSGYFMCDIGDKLP